MKHLKVILIVVATALLITFVVWPVKKQCPNGPCTTAPDAQGLVRTYYEVQPLGAVVIEDVTGQHVAVAYSSGYDNKKYRQ
ncbi:hypothetical protein [Mycobacterium asiaticum]|uniref:Uncharacterized protein n=1 Tax=Mycobacterium asiaticum TaxID=1790 RepID=A0A1A3C3A6_MYCAS|nr:hypothetical protein [Mycobacterium asiaticum]OBI81590.1 hypothetical protein A9X01_23280 [Mycobacterium asiaticum]